MEESLSARIAAAIQQSQEEGVDKFALAGLLRTFEDEAEGRFQFLGIAQAYMIMDLYANAEQVCDKALGAPGDRTEEAIAYHYKGRSLQFMANEFYNQGNRDVADHTLRLSLQMYRRSLIEEAEEQFIFGSLTNVAYVHFRLEHYRKAILTIAHIMRFQTASEFKLSKEEKEGLQDLLLRSLSELKTESGFDNEGSN